MFIDCETSIPVSLFHISLNKMVLGFQKEQKKAPPFQATHKGADAKRNNNNL